ncbi:MAG: acyl-CoA dehydratase activase-related protein [Deltaproteobacteria bacterium]|nr:acyl-CoA dehydratase activase-related protein [Deltaproteobacteria bacterium]
MKRWIGIDVGAETVKVVELTGEERNLKWTRRILVEHRKEPGTHLVEALRELDFAGADGASVTGRLSRLVDLPRIPTKQAEGAGFRFLFPGVEPATIVSIGSHGFSVLELRAHGVEVYRENSRCSQGTGNFLRQLVERFDMGVAEASALTANVDSPAALSGRCPVILKTDMTHLANKGEPVPRILAGLYDAVAENVEVLIKPRLSPPRVALVGGVSRSPRVRAHFRAFLARHGMGLLETKTDDGLFLDALGCAVLASMGGKPAPRLDAILRRAGEHRLDRIPALTGSLHKVTRLAAPPAPDAIEPRGVVLGFDIGSTGSKVVALDAHSGEPVWQAYVGTNGAPVAAAQELTRRFFEGPLGSAPVLAVGATGSGREIVGSLMTTCYGPEAVYVLNEIAAHAEGALHYDSRVDTIFEIGGQDAKYIRLAGGKVVDAAMNEACSAGTGSFIEEQGRRMSGVGGVVGLGEEALAADGGVSLGQHCSVFMAEIIDEAVAAGVPRPRIVAGIYDSIVQNYLNRVKGSRSVGDVVFCQGMPFSSDALAAAVAHRTGSEVIVPPDPGTIGALGIALLARREIDLGARAPLDLGRFLRAEVIEKDVFHCKSTKGCGGAGDRCRIDRLKTLVAGRKQVFTWGGGCSLNDKASRRVKLPDLAPDPFREREALVRRIREPLEAHRGRPRVAITDEFALKELFPFFATYIHELGFDLAVVTGAGQAMLKRGIEDANVPFCAPMQQYHGLAAAMAALGTERVFLPMVRSLPRVRDEKWSKLCPIVQGSPDLLRLNLGRDVANRIISPVITTGVRGLESDLFRSSCEALARELGVEKELFERAFVAAVAAQTAFSTECLAIGTRALSFAREHGIVPVVVLGRSYTIHNTVLNSNVPAILREQGAIGVPLDCYEVGADVPIFNDMFWSYGQRNLRAAEQIRKTPGVYSLYCSNYSCGPDSFTIHFYGYVMQGKPFAIIETDGHSGDAGTKTRVEAFLHCVRGDLRREAPAARTTSLEGIEAHREGLKEIRERGATVLIPRMGPGAEALAACLNGFGLQSEALPMPTRDTLALGRRHTSGKECVPMTLTLGSLLERVERARGTDERFSFLMPTASGPCRFGAYNTLHKIVLERLGLKDRVGMFSPPDSNYFEGAGPGLAAIVFTGLVASDLLVEGLYDTRPAQLQPGAAEACFAFYHRELLGLLARAAAGDLGAGSAMGEVVSGNVFGVAPLLRRAARAYARLKIDGPPMPTVLVVGEIYVRCDPFANDFVVDKLEQRGIRCRFAAFNEWLEYTDYQDVRKKTVPDYVTSLLQASIQSQLFINVADVLGWPRRTTVQDSISAAAPYIREQLSGEAVLTVGGPLHEWREGHIDGAVSVGPLECMPNKIAESQFFHVAEREGLVTLTLSLNGDPVDPEVLDNFAYEVRARFDRRRKGESASPPRPPGPRRPSWVPQSRLNVRE